MAIEFQCPHCQATMKAPDDASGKSSRCPQCQTKLIVPVVEIPAQSTPEQEEQYSVEHTVAGEFSDAVTNTEQLANPAFPAFEQPVRKPSPTLQRLRNRRRQQLPTWLIPVCFGGIILIVLVFLYWKNQPELKGTAKATAVSEPAFDIQRIAYESIGVDKTTRETVLNDLAKQPYVFKTDHITCVFQGSSAGLNIQLEPAPRTKIVRVNLKSKTLLHNSLRAQRNELARVKQSTLEQALKEFFKAFAAAINQNQPMDDSLRFYYDIGLNTQVSELGYHLRARYANKIYHCIYEDELGVYFALPEHTKRFQLVGRKGDDARVLLPVNYDVVIGKSTNSSNN